MLNEEKISLMTKLALYEQSEGKRDIPMSGYYRGDYIALKVVNSAIVGTIAYFIVIASLILINVEDLLNKLTEIDLIAEGRRLLVYYLVFLVCYMIIAYIFYSVKFKSVRDKLNQYNADLKKLYEMYRNDKKNKDVVASSNTPLEKKRRKVRREFVEEFTEENEEPVEEKKSDIYSDDDLDEILQLIEEE